jgi:hypothetical protein
VVAFCCIRKEGGVRVVSDIFAFSLKWLRLIIDIYCPCRILPYTAVIQITTLY